MSRLALAVVLVAGVASARPRRAEREASPKGDNMPRGFTWPPSRAMVAAERACEAKLDELGVTWTAAKARGHVVDPIIIPDGQIGGIAYVALYEKTPPVMDCELAAALATIAPHLYELGVREIHVGSTYRWSKVRVGGKTKNLLSRHALGLAMDVVSFVDDAGREAVVKRDYKAGDELLLAIEHTIDESGTFRLVLTPKNDPISHKDHFHVEANPDFDASTDERPRS